MLLTLPNNRISLIEFLFEKVPDWKNLQSIFISQSAFLKMKEDPSLKQNGSMWVREESEFTDYLLPLSYELKQIRFDLWMIEWIEYDGNRRYFSSNPLGKSVVHISCEQFAKKNT